MVSLTCRSVVLFFLLFTFIFAFWVAFSNLLYPGIGLTLEKTTGGEMPSLTICPLDYDSKNATKWRLDKGKNSIEDILSVLPSMKNYLEFHLWFARNTR